MAKPPEGWDEVFSGACLEADLIQAVLEANGLRPITRRLSSEGVWSGSVFEDCRVYVPVDQLRAAREVLATKHDPDT
ncbi:MAG TPA: hypothetical protein VKF14_04935 [Candidatus Dormibacteraeota bacterium]|nr:hypothetical protein [Candidatus Dormibacteraeota bacterium]